ncbi:MAG: nucleotide exchange factor GrpE [Verrucomicrobia bacterium]|nr:nucleotide exchange factor GrpE [Verrucomicrobiota bacterium]MBM3870066.1 nucleotide exchange factor GrpE [Verrucomicrobiota bacterium]
MSDRPEARLARWPSVMPFLIGAALLDAFAWWVVDKSDKPINIWIAVLALVSVACATWASVIPFLNDAQNAVKLDELQKLQTAATQINNLEKVATQITIATAQWQNVQEHNAKAIESAKHISEEMSAEAVRFAEFMKKANDSEKATLRLEVEKLKRAESDWLQVLVRVLDHVFALHRAGKHSGQQNLIEQLAHFQNACRDAARLIGLVAFAPTPGDKFVPGQHQVADGRKDVPSDAKVFETVAPGYTFQGQMLRPALVLLDAPAAKPAPASSAAEVDLPLS